MGELASNVDESVTIQRSVFINLVAQVLVSEDDFSGSPSRLSQTRARQTAGRIFDLLLDVGHEDS
jgi:hypothetical protein